MAKELGRTAKFYRKNKAAYKRKKAYDAELKKRPDQVKKRVEAIQKRRDAKKAGKNIKGKDYDHATNSFVDPKTNRGRAGEGGRKKGKKVRRKVSGSQVKKMSSKASGTRRAGKVRRVR